MSTRRRIYLDWNATAPLGDAARVAMALAMVETGNPSSVHTEGRRARDRVERARAEVATLAGRPPEQVVFTSGGTEANALGVVALAREAERRGLPKLAVMSAIEHPSLVGAVESLHTRGWEVHRSEHPPFGLYAAGLVNHELGTILPHVRIELARQAGALVHIDAVQAAGKVSLANLDADAIALSAHKLGGPQGSGALVIALDRELPIVDGGHQERGRRPGTENAIGIAGFGAAAAAADVGAWMHVAMLGDTLEHGLRELGARIHGVGPRVGGTINAAWDGALGESIVIALDLEGIAVSTGAACTSGSIQPSPVLLALGMSSDQAREAVRFSLGRSTTAAEIDEVLRVVPAIVERARKHR